MGREKDEDFKFLRKLEVASTELKYKLHYIMGSLGLDVNETPVNPSREPSDKSLVLLIKEVLAGKVVEIIGRPAFQHPKRLVLNKVSRMITSTWKIEDAATICIQA